MDSSTTESYAIAKPTEFHYVVRISLAISDTDYLYLCKDPWDLLWVNIRINHREPLMLSPEFGLLYIRYLTSGADLATPKAKGHPDNQEIWNNLKIVRSTIASRAQINEVVRVELVQCASEKEVAIASFTYVPNPPH